MSGSPTPVRRQPKAELIGGRSPSPSFVRGSSGIQQPLRRSSTGTSTSGSTDVVGSVLGRRGAPPPPNVTVVQGVPTSFSQNQQASASTSSILNYLYHSGLRHHNNGPPLPPSIASSPFHHGLPPSFPSLPPSGPQSTLPVLPPVPPFPVAGGAATEPPFPFPPGAVDTAGLVQAAAAVAAGLQHHLNPAALMLSAAGQLAAVHPWLYPSYLAAAATAAIGQAAAASALQQQQQPLSASSASHHSIPPSGRRSSSPQNRHHHHYNHHNHRSNHGASPSSPSSTASSYRYAPYPTSGRRLESPTPAAVLSGSLSAHLPSSSSVLPAGAASPPAAPDTTDSPGISGAGSQTGSGPEYGRPTAESPGIARPSSTASSISPPSAGNERYLSRSKSSFIGSGGNRRDGLLAPGTGSGEELKNIEQMVHGLDRSSAKTAWLGGGSVDDSELRGGATGEMDVDSSKN